MDKRKIKPGDFVKWTSFAMDYGETDEVEYCLVVSVKEANRLYKRNNKGGCTTTNATSIRRDNKFSSKPIFIVRIAGTHKDMMNESVGWMPEDSLEHCNAAEMILFGKELRNAKLHKSSK